MGIDQLLELITRRWMLIAACIVAGLLLAGLYLQFAVPVYRSQALVVVASPGSSVPAASGQLGGLASLAGFQISGQADREEAVAYLGSSHLVAQFIEKYGILPRLFAKEWDKTKGAWVSSRRTPTIGDGVRKFREDIFNVSQDRKSGLLTLTIDWSSRDESADWINKLVALANEQMRSRAMRNAEVSMQYLKQELVSAQVVEVREMLARLQESQLRTLTYARSNPEYSFRVLDPPMVPDAHRPLRPRPALTMVAGFIVGAILASIAVILAEAWRLYGGRRIVHPAP